MDVKPSASLNLTASPSAPTATTFTTPHPLPPRPTSDFAAKADSIGLGGPKTAETALHAPMAAQALAGSNRDVVANRRAIRMANMSAAEMLKAELAGLTPLKPSASKLSQSASSAPARSTPSASTTTQETSAFINHDDNEVPGLGGSHDSVMTTTENDVDASGEPDTEVAPEALMIDPEEMLDESPKGVKRTIDKVEAEEGDDDLGSDDEDAPSATALNYKVNPDGTVDQEDIVKYVDVTVSLRQADHVPQTLGARIQGALLSSEVRR